MNSTNRRARRGVETPETHRVHGAQAETGTSWVKFHSEAALATFAERIRAEERADYDRKLALQQASYEREMATEVEAEREACAQLCDSMQYAEEQTPMNCAEAIRARRTTRGEQ